MDCIIAVNNFCISVIHNVLYIMFKMSLFMITQPLAKLVDYTAAPGDMKFLKD